MVLDWLRAGLPAVNDVLAHYSLRVFEDSAAERETWASPIGVQNGKEDRSSSQFSNILSTPLIFASCMGYIKKYP